MRSCTVSIMAAMSLLLAACQGDTSGVDPQAAMGTGAETDQAASPTPVQAQASFGDIQSASRLPGVAAVDMSGSWAERVSKLSSEDREYVQDANRRYFGSLRYSSTEELQKLISLGFPTVEDWLAAKRMHDVELAKLAESGNSKAKLLYADRLASRLESVPRGADRSEKQPEADRRMASAASAATAAADDALAASRSPFAAYVVGYQRSTIYGSPEPMVAAMFMARSLGDQRAGNLLAQAGVSGSDPSAVFAVYNGMLSTMRR
jgi:hypothetical protein